MGVVKGKDRNRRPQGVRRRKATAGNGLAVPGRWRRVCAAEGARKRGVKEGVTAPSAERPGGRGNGGWGEWRNASRGRWKAVPIEGPSLLRGPGAACGRGG